MQNKRSIGIWILSGLLAAEFLLAGGMKLSGSEQIAEQFTGFGYSRTFMYLVGAAEVICAPLLLWPRMAFYAAVFLSAILCGAVFSHISTGIGSFIPAAVVLALTVWLAWLRRP